MIIKPLIASALSLGLLASSPMITVANASQEIFGNMEGKWRGKGLVKASSKGKKESIRCRMNNKIKSDGKKLDLGGSCAVSGFVFSLNGFIEQTGGNNYRASMFRSIAFIKQESFGGKRSGKRINFNFNAVDRGSKKPIKASIRLNSKTDKTFEVSISRTDPATGKNFDVGTLQFSKR